MTGLQHITYTSFKVDSAYWHDHIIFCDYFNAHPFVAKTYEALKIKLASEYPHDIR